MTSSGFYVIFWEMTSLCGAVGEIEVLDFISSLAEVSGGFSGFKGLQGASRGFKGLQGCFRVFHDVIRSPGSKEKKNTNVKKSQSCTAISMTSPNPK